MSRSLHILFAFFILLAALVSCKDRDTFSQTAVASDIVGQMFKDTLGFNVLGETIQLDFESKSGWFIESSSKPDWIFVHEKGSSAIITSGESGTNSILLEAKLNADKQKRSGIVVIKENDGSSMATIKVGQDFPYIRVLDKNESEFEDGFSFRWSDRQSKDSIIYVESNIDWNLNITSDSGHNWVRLNDKNDVRLNHQFDSTGNAKFAISPREFNFSYTDSVAVLKISPKLDILANAVDSYEFNLSQSHLRFTVSIDDQPLSSADAVFVFDEFGYTTDKNGTKTQEIKLSVDSELDWEITSSETGFVGFSGGTSGKASDPGAVRETRLSINHAESGKVNPTKEQKSQTFVLKGKSGDDKTDEVLPERRITINQDAYKFELSAFKDNYGKEASSLRFNNGDYGQSYTATLTTKGKWVIVSSASWLYIETKPVSGTTEIVVKLNNDNGQNLSFEEVLSSLIIQPDYDWVANSELRYSFEINQAPFVFDVTFNDNQLEPDVFPAIGYQPQTINVNSSGAWEYFVKDDEGNDIDFLDVIKVDDKKATFKPKSDSGSEKDLTAKLTIQSMLHAANNNLSEKSQKVFTITQKPIIRVDKVTLSTSTLNLKRGIQNESSKTIKATVEPFDATFPTVTWSSSDPSVASVKDGVVTAEKSGNATITATADGVEATCAVVVTTPVTGLSLSPESKSMNKGFSFSLTATVSPIDADDTVVTWSSDKPDVVRVDSKGNITALNGGNATITASVGGFTRECKVIVIVPVESITLNNTRLDLVKGDPDTETATLKATLNPTDATYSVTWSSNDKSVATVNEYGVVSAVGSGTTQIIASAGGKNEYCNVSVTNPVRSITLTDKAISLTEGDIQDLKVVIDPDDADNKTVSWKSSNNEVATVNGNGRVTAVAEGTAIITASCGPFYDECEITVKKKVIPVTSITLEAQEMTLTVGDNMTITAIVEPDNATDKTITWNSDNESVAKVDENGNVIAVALGTATISVKAGDKTAYCEIHVVIPLNQIWYTTDNGDQIIPNSGTSFFNSSGETIDYNQIRDGERWIVQLSDDVSYWEGNWFTNTGSGYPRLATLGLPSGLDSVRMADMSLYQKSYYQNYVSSIESFFGEYRGIADNGHLLLAGNDFKKVIGVATAYAETITIPEGVTIIGLYSFTGSKAKVIIIPSTIEEIGEYAFENCNDLTDVYCYAINCPVIKKNSYTNEDDIWTYFSGSSGKLHCPKGSDYSAFPLPEGWTLIDDIIL